MHEWVPAVSEDQNFDGIVDKFAQNIYGSTKGRIREAVLQQDLNHLLAQLPARPLRILDAGGGMGQLSRFLASQGHFVTLCDISQEMLESAAAAAAAEGLSDRMQFVHCPAQQVGEHLDAPVDLILFHAVLEWVEDPVEVLTRLAEQLVPGGALSLMFYNYNGMLHHHLIGGNFDYVNAGMPRRRKKSLVPTHPRHPEQVYQWLTDLQLRIVGKTGVRVLHDYLRDKSQQETKFELLLEMEQRYCRQEPYISLGRYIHVMARKPEMKF
ncbi:MAG: tRNA uridine 5-oxyacetic acid(34) methyltransferase CmoM [Plesiomonas shigelloides]